MNIGQTYLGKYVVKDLIGAGAEGLVAKAEEVPTGNTVAIKAIECRPGTPGYEQRLARCQRAASLRIGGSVVVDPIDSGQEDGWFYIVMSFVAGLNLQSFVKSHGGKLPVDLAVALLRSLAEGLDAAHGKQVVHRDLKPDNIIVDDLNRAHVLDFGICRLTSEKTITESDGILGTLHWLSPEQVVHSAVDHRSDLYTLGALFYYMLTGRGPVEGDDTSAVVLSICRTIPPSPRQIQPAIPPHIDRVCMKLLAKRPEDRFQTASEICTALNGVHATAQPGRSCCSCATVIQPGYRYCPACGATQLSDSNGVLFCLACGCVAGTESNCPGCRRTFSRHEHRLVFRAGTLSGSSFRIPEGMFDVGREQLRGRDQQISRRHFRVACCDGTLSIEDAGSTNKTYLAGQMADHPVQLQSGQDLAIAGNIATYTCN